MSGHVKWESVKAEMNEVIPYHQGYILAMQDILNNMARMTRSGMYTRECLRAEIQDSLDSARASLEACVRLNTDD